MYKQQLTLLNLPLARNTCEEHVIIKSYLRDTIENVIKLELCAFALKGEHNVYSLVPKIAVCMYIYILIPSCSPLAVGSNIVQITHFWTFQIDTQLGCFRSFWMSEIHFGSHFWPFQIDRAFWISEID